MSVEQAAALPARPQLSFFAHYLRAWVAPWIGAGIPLAHLAAGMVAVDRLGFKLRVRTGDGLEGCRVAFPRDVTDAGQCRRVLIEMLEDCRKRPRVG